MNRGSLPLTQHHLVAAGIFSLPAEQLRDPNPSHELDVAPRRPHTHPCTYRHTCIHKQTHTHTRTHAHTPVYINGHTHTPLYSCTHTCIHKWTHPPLDTNARQVTHGTPGSRVSRSFTIAGHIPRGSQLRLSTPQGPHHNKPV